MNALVLLVPILAAAGPQAAAPPKVSAKLYAAHASIQPGGKTDLAIEIDLQPGWHAYDPVIVDTGAPTTITFEAPPGVTIDPLRFPVPTLEKDHDLEYLAHSGKFVVLTTMALGSDYGARKLAVKATVHALVCKELCVPVDVPAALTLKVSSAAPAPANEELFKEAREALPKPLASAPRIVGSGVTLKPEQLGLNQEAELTVTVRVEKGHHTQDRDPGNDLLIPSRLFIEPLDGLKFGDQVWPQPKIVEMKDYGKVRELRGDVTIRVPISVIDSEFASGPVALKLLFTYQVCNDAGTCFPPEAAESLVRFVADTPNPAPSGVAALGATIPVVRPPTVDAGGTGLSAALLWQLLLAFIGGMILNVMPCVFPVISIKIIGFVKQAGEDRGRVLRLGLAFCAGIMVWFWIFGYLTGLGQVPWQYPPVVIGLTALMFLFALNLFGVFEIFLPGAAADKLTEVASREGYWGSFLKGLLATLLGTACTAPFFASAAAYAALQPPSVAFLIFTCAGLGMALPYVLLSAFPGWLRWLPKPGAWMETFKQAMGFVLIGTAVWLLLIVGDLLDVRGLVWTVAFLAFLAFSAWLIGRIRLNWEARSRVITWVAALGVAVFGLWFCFFLMYDVRSAGRSTGSNGRPVAGAVSADPDTVIAAIAASDWNGHVPWQPWAPGLPEVLARRGHTVYVDFTATWCVTCQTNKATAVDIEATRQKMKAAGVIPLKADYTKRDPVMREKLLQFGHNSVPLNLIYPAGRPHDVIQLPVLLTPGSVADALEKAGASVKPAATTSPSQPTTANTEDRGSP